MRIALLVATAVAVGATSAVGGGTASVSTDSTRYVVGDEVVITLTNDTKSDIALDEPWQVAKTRNDKVVATRTWRSGKTVASGESATWRWDQHKDDGGEVAPNKFVVTAPTSVGMFEATFSIGRYFTLGFDGSDATFVVFVRRARAAAQMKDEAEAEDKSLIVSGIVKDVAPYNPQWSYSMGPGSIVLGEAFIEVCDASPEYVEENRDEWMGQRWCPWSSYVEKEGY